jgi:hypothetical protein
LCTFPKFVNPKQFPPAGQCQFSLPHQQPFGSRKVQNNAHVDFRNRETRLSHHVEEERSSYSPGLVSAKFLCTPGETVTWGCNIQTRLIPSETTSLHQLFVTTRIVLKQCTDVGLVRICIASSFNQRVI